MVDKVNHRHSLLAHTTPTILPLAAFPSRRAFNVDLDDLSSAIGSLQSPEGRKGGTMHTRLALKTQLKITPQLVMAGHLLQAPLSEVEQRVTHELAENPALEWVRPRRAPLIPSARAGPSLDDLSEVLPSRQTALAQLAAQAAWMVDAAEQETAIALLCALDEHGYLRPSTQELARRLDVDRETVERLVRVLHQLEPPGIGARDPQECLLIQCRHLEADGVGCHLARRILAEAWDDFARQRWERVAQILRIPYDQVEEACRFIARNLHPYPLAMVRDTPAEDATPAFPDLIVRRPERGGRPGFSLELPGEAWFELRICDGFESALRTPQDSLAPAERTWVRDRVEQGRLFIAALAQRWATLRRIGECLIHRQAGFLEGGPLYLQPLTRAAVAAELGLHESTVSRAVSGKAIQLPDGRLAPLSDLFDASLPAREAIRRVLSKTQQPLSDGEIAQRLRAEGFVLARRTVAKYRAQLNIPAAYEWGHRSSQMMPGE